MQHSISTTIEYNNHLLLSYIPWYGGLGSSQAAAYQLLVTYSAAYARLLGSKRLSGPAQHQPRPRRNHCSTTAPHCLCQYIKAKVL